MSPVALIAAAALFSAAVLEEPADGPSSEQVAALVESLSAPSRSARIRAERALTALGPDIAALLPAVGSPAAPTGAAALAALERVRAALAAAPAVNAGPSRLPLADLPRDSLGAQLEAVEERTGNRLDLSALPPETLNAAAPDLSALAEANGTATFWTALNALAPGRFAMGAVEDDGLTLLPPAENDHAPAATADGLVRIETGPVAVRPRFGADGSLWRIPVRLIVEPRVQPLTARPIEGGLTAKSGETALSPFSPGASREAAFTNGVTTFAVDFLPPTGAEPSDEPPALAVGGAFEVVAIPGRRTFRFAPDAVGKVQTADGVTVRLEAVTPTAESVTVAAAVLYDADGGGPAFESYQTWRYAAALQLRTPAGAVIEPTNAPRIVSEGAAAVAIRADFVPPEGTDLSQFQIEVRAPAAPVTTAVQFEGIDVPAETIAEGTAPPAP